MSSFCGNCGKKASAGDKFCGDCGAQLSTMPESTVATHTFPESETSGQEVKGGSRRGQIIAAIILVAIIAGVHFGSEWLEKRRKEKDKPLVPSSKLFKPQPVPKMPEKTGFNRSPDSNDTDSPDNFDELLRDMVINELDLNEKEAEEITIEHDAGENSQAGGGIPFIRPGGYIFISGIWNQNCNAEIEKVTMELSVENSGRTTGTLFSKDGMGFLCEIEGSMTANGKLNVSGRLDNGGYARIKGTLKHEPFSSFLKGDGKFNIDVGGSGGNMQCSGTWQTE